MGQESEPNSNSSTSTCSIPALPAVSDLGLMWEEKRKRKEDWEKVGRMGNGREREGRREEKGHWGSLLQSNFYWLKRKQCKLLFTSFPTLSMDLGTNNQRMQEISEFTEFSEK